MKIFRPNIFDCGVTKPRLLKEQLTHYRACDHEDCKKRLRSWEAILERFRAGKPQHGEKFQ